MDKNYSQIILNGIKKGDTIGGPYELAKIVSKSISSCNGFNKDDLISHYSVWWKTDAFDTGPTFASVFSKIQNGVKPDIAVQKVHQDFYFNTAGCGPAHRCSPIAGFLYIPTNKLVSIAREEAKITHFDDDAGYGSAIIVMLCRHLIEGKSWEDAKFLLANDEFLQESWYKVKNANLIPDGYIFNVIHSALHFINENKSLEEAIKFSGKANYCAILVSVILSLLNRH